MSDLDNYLPTQDAWVELTKYETRQWLTVDSVTTPTKWAEAEAQAGDELLPGTTALTIHGTRHRSGIWEGEPVSSEHDVAFTVFLVCAPSYPECHLLRLSMLDKPLGLTDGQGRRWRTGRRSFSARPASCSASAHF